MVCLLAKDATVCCILDSLLLSHPSPSSSPHTHTAAADTADAPKPPPLRAQHLRRDFLQGYCATLCETIPPSQLHDALWLTLLLRHRTLTCPPRASSSTVTEGTTGMTSTIATEANDNNTTHTLGDYAMRSQEKELPRRGRLSDSLSDYQTPAQLESLLRERYEYGADTTPTHQPESNSTLVLLDSRLLAMLSPPRRSGDGDGAAVVAESATTWRAARTLLRQPRWMHHIVHTLEALWCVLALCRRLRRLQQQRADWLLGESAMRVSNVSARDETEYGRHRHRHDGDTFFHDYELLLPVSFVQSLLAQLGDSVGSCSLSLPALLRRCGTTPHLSTPSASLSVPPHTRDARHDTIHVCDSHRSDTAAIAPHDTTVCTSNPSMYNSCACAHREHLSLIIHPATSSTSHNPDRAVKNTRIDVIDTAVQDYYYHNRIAVPRPSRRGGATGLDSSRRMSDGVSVIDPRDVRDGVAREERQRGESYASFVQSISIGFDIQLMALTGAVVGYYLGYLRGASTEMCISYGAVGLVTMLLVDATLLIIRVGRSDAAMRQQRKNILRQRRKLLPSHASGGGPAVCEAGGATGRWGVCRRLVRCRTRR